MKFMAIIISLISTKEISECVKDRFSQLCPKLGSKLSGKVAMVLHHINLETQSRRLQ